MVDKASGKGAKPAGIKSRKLEKGPSEANGKYRDVRARGGKASASTSTSTVGERKTYTDAGDDLAARLVSCLANVGGVRLRFKKTIPIYYADAKRPWLVVRQLGRLKETGRVTKKGRFVKVP